MKHRYDTVIPQLVDEMLEFHNTALGEQVKHTNNPYDSKYISLTTHRRYGYTSAALDLLEDFTSALLIQPDGRILTGTKMLARSQNRDPILEERMEAATFMAPKWFAGKYDQNTYHQLIIMDTMSIMEAQLNKIEPHGLNQFRDRLFMHCDILLELG